MRYPGGKNGAGVYQTIINCIPEHRVYVEPFAGSAAIARRKLPAASSVLYELDPAMVDQLRRCLPAAAIVNGDGIAAMVQMAARQPGLKGYFFYCDPPYLHSTRRDLALYQHELDDAGHEHLVASVLPAIGSSGGLFALSGYRSAMYDAAAAAHGWHRLDFQAMTRRGVATESLWTNYDPATIKRADLTYLGSTYRERERLKRKAARWVAKLSAMPDLERQFILASISSADGDARGAA